MCRIQHTLSAMEVAIVTECVIMLKSSALTWVFPRTKELAHLGWPLTSKSSIYGWFLARFNFMRANNGRPRRSIIFIRRSIWWMRVRTPLARIYVCTTCKSLRVHSVACIYLLHFLSVAINFRSTFSLLNTPRKNEEEEPRRKCRQLHRDFAHHESFAKTAR